MPDYFPNLECNRKTGIFDCQASNFVEQLRKSADKLEAEQERLENEIKALTEERQRVITQARKGNLIAPDMEYQLSAITLQEVNLKHELASLGQVISINALNNWESKVEESFADKKEKSASEFLTPNSSYFISIAPFDARET